MRYKYITVKLSRSSSLAVINSAAIGSWMLWQFLLAWLWKSEPTCHGSSSDLLATESLIHFHHLANEVYWINFLWANWILTFSPYTLLLRVTLLHFSYCWWSTWWVVGSCVVFIIGKVQINWVSCKSPRSCLRWEHRMWQWAQRQMTQSIHVEMKCSCCEMKWMCLHEGVHREHLIPVRHLWGHWSSNNLTPTKTLQSCWSGIGCLEINAIFSIDSYKLQGRLKAMSSIQSWSVGFSWNFALGR